MNLLEMRTQFVRQTGHYSLIGTKIVGSDTVPDFTVDMGADYYLNKAIRALEGRVKVRENFKKLTVALDAKASSGYIPMLKSIKYGHHIVAGVSKPLQLTSVEYIEEVSLTEEMAEEGVYPLIAISDGTAPTVVPDTYLLFGGWYVVSSWDSNGLVLQSLNDVLPIEGLWQPGTLPTFTPNKLYELEEGEQGLGDVLGLIATLLTDCLLVYIFSGEAGMHTISVEVTGDFSGMYVAPLTLERAGEALHYRPVEDLSENMFLLTNDTPSGEVTLPIICNALAFVPAVDDWLAEEILTQSTSFVSFEDLNESEEVVVEEVTPANIYIYPPADVASTLSLYGWVYSEPLENNLDANWWSTKHYNVVIDQAAVELNVGLLNADVQLLIGRVERFVKDIVSDDISTEIEMLGARFV